MIRDLVLDAQTAEPAVRQVDRNLPAEQPLRTDGKNVADDEHPDHQHRVNRRAAARRVVGCKLSTHPGQIEHGGDLAHKVIAWYHLVVPKLVEKLLLLVLQPPHHRSPPQRIMSERRNHRSQKPSTGFCNKICHKATYAVQQGCIWIYLLPPPGRRTVNTEPLPNSLATVTSPPIMRASLRVMARPSPVPPKRCAVVLSAWANSSNSFACCSAVMPMPLSATATSIQSRPSTNLRALSLTSPSFVNLQALLRRLSRICRSRIGSTVSSPRSAEASTTKWFLFCSAS